MRPQIQPPLPLFTLLLFVFIFNSKETIGSDRALPLFSDRKASAMDFQEVNGLLQEFFRVSGTAKGRLSGPVTGLKVQAVSI